MNFECQVSQSNPREAARSQPREHAPSFAQTCCRPAGASLHSITGTGEALPRFRSALGSRTSGGRRRRLTAPSPPYTPDAASSQQCLIFLEALARGAAVSTGAANGLQQTAVHSRSLQPCRAACATPAGGRAPGAFTDTGYGTHDGQGNVPTGAQYQQGTGACSCEKAMLCYRLSAPRVA